MIVSYLKWLLKALHTTPWRAVAHGLHQRFREDRLGQSAGALTFTSTMALVPLLTVFLAVLTAFPIFGQFQTSIQRWLVESLVPDSLSRQVLGYVTQFTSKASRLGSLGFALLVLSALAVVLTIERTLNAIWRIRRPRRWGQRLLVYGSILTLGPLVVAASFFMVGSAGSLLGMVATTGVMGVLLGVVEFGFAWLAIGALFKYVPNVHVPWSHALMGAAFTAVSMELARKLVALYVAKVSTFSLVYGAFATLPILLVWMYTVWLLVLMGAVLVAGWPAWVQPATRDATAPGWRFQLALEVLGQLRLARTNSMGGLDAACLASKLASDVHVLSEVLATLSEMGWIGLLDEGGVERAQRYVLLIDDRATEVGMLADNLLLAAAPQVALMRQGWQGMRVAQLLDKLDNRC